MLTSLIPLFDENMSVTAYSLFTLKNNYLLNPKSIGTGENDGACTISGLEVLNSIGIETLANDREIFVEINHVSVYADIASQCSVSNERIVLLLDSRIKPEDKVVNRLKELKDQGFKLAMRKLRVNQFQEYAPILSLLDYVLLNHSKIDISKARIFFEKLYPGIELCAVNVNTKEEFEKLRETGGYKYYEGEFFRRPVSEKDTEIAPLKINYIELMNVVNAVDFDLNTAADVISRDASLVISVLKIANKLTRNSEITSVKHACAMIGQKELKRWINTALTGELCADRPSEIIRMVMIRAKFAEGLAKEFGFAMQADDLFLMGLFSMLDVMLDLPIEEAFDMVVAPKEIRDSIVRDDGKYSEVMNFIRAYENADWTAIGRTMILKDIDENFISEKYIAALSWYHEMFGIAE